MNAAIDLQLALTVLTFAAVLGLWIYLWRHILRVDHLDRRLSLLEERTSGMRERHGVVDNLAAQVAALRERVDTSYQLMRTIQTYLMENKR